MMSIRFLTTDGHGWTRMCGCPENREGGARAAMARRKGMPGGRTGGARPASDPLENGSAGLDYEAGARVERGAGFGDEGDGAVISAPLLRCQLAAHVAALGIVELNEGIFGEKFTVGFWRLGAVTTRADRRADKFGAHTP